MGNIFLRIQQAPTGHRDIQGAGMNTQRRQAQIDEFRLELAEDAEKQEDPNEDEINAIAVAAVREVQQESKRAWQAERGIGPARSPGVTLSSADARDNWAALLRFVYQQGSKVAIERRGEPIAVVMSYADFVTLDRLAFEVLMKERGESEPTS
jgi:prevent-host-death family protein